MGTIDTVKNKTFRKFLESQGLTLVRTKGDHVVYSKPNLPRPIIFRANGEIPLLHIYTNLRTLNISKKEFLKFLEKPKK